MDMEKDLTILINRGFKMEAVKMLRLYYSVDLMTAKKMVDEWEGVQQGRQEWDSVKPLLN